jgi:hypothetical protein
MLKPQLRRRRGPRGHQQTGCGKRAGAEDLSGGRDEVNLYRVRSQF